MLATTTDAPSASRLFSEKIYWLNQLQGELPETALITDFVGAQNEGSHPGGNTGGNAGGNKNQSVEFELDGAVSRAVINLARGSDLSVYVLLLSVVSTLLTRYTRRLDFIVGVPAYATGAGEPGNVALPLRGQIVGGSSFKDVLLQTKANLIDVYLHQTYPLEALYEALYAQIGGSQPKRPLLFDVVVLLENIHSAAAIADLKTSLTIAFAIEGDRIRGRIDYSDALFAAGTIQQLARCCVNGIESVVHQPTSPVEDIAFLKAADRERQLAFNSPPVASTGAYPLQQTISQLFEVQVAQTPDRPAAVWRQIRLTYRELNGQANQIGRYLQQLGLQPGEFVGILKGRDIHFLSAILAIHKAGGAYVPMDSAYPRDRLRYMLADSEVRFVLTDAATLESLGDLFGDGGDGVTQIVCLEALPDDFTTAAAVKISDRSAFSQLAADNLSGPQSAIYPAYMLYTSGSTGRPKGAI
ncbi:MAG: AMP-binding protein, partial [Cyanobacteria bacterium P01_D01_bin.128]